MPQSATSEPRVKGLVGVASSGTQGYENGVRGWKVSGDTWRKALFGAVAYLVVFGLVELAFRVAGSGHSTSLLIHEEHNGSPWLSVNEHYVEQFSMVDPESVPDPMPALFKRDRPTDEFRIYVIGESTSRGFPHSSTEAFPYRLQQLLNAAQTSRKVRVYNFSIDATNSHIGVRVAQELAKDPPDLAVIYYGHNEFIGIGGAGAFHQPVFQLNVLMSKLRSYQWLRGILIRSRGEDDRSILSRLASKPGVPYKGPVFAKTLSDFGANYRAMLQAFKAANVPTVACGVVSNVADLPPLGTKPKPSVADVKRVESLAANGPSPELDAALGDNATLNFRAGRVLLEGGQQEAARRLLTRARDLDPLRFRAASEVNPLIEQACKGSKCSYVDFAKLFAQKSEAGVVGNALMLEHVHPTLGGHNLMAIELSRVVLQEHFKGVEPGAIQEPRPLASIVDRFKATHTLLNVLQSFPYAGSEYFNPAATEYVYVDMQSAKAPRKLHSKFDPELHQFLVKVSAEAPGGVVEASLLHTKLAFWYLERERVGEAYRELKIAVEQHPRNCQAQSNLAYLEYKLNVDVDRALELLAMANQRCPDYPSAHLNKWVLLTRLGRHAEAKEAEQRLAALGVTPKKGQKFELDDPKVQ